MKKCLYTLITLLLVPVLVNAETLEYNICKSGCEYSSLEEIMNHYNEIYNEVGEEVFSTYDVIINFKDSETYEIEYFWFNDLNSMTIKGNNATLTTEKFVLEEINKAKIEGININTIDIYIEGEMAKFSLDPPNYSYKDNDFILDNCIIKVDDSVGLYFGFFHILNSIITTSKFSDYLLAEIEFKNSHIPYGIIAGAGGDRTIGFDTNVYLNLKDLENNIEIIRYFASEENVNELLRRYPELNDSNVELDKYFFVEYPLTEEYITNGITKTNNIFIKQEIYKAIKTNTNISEFEGEFVNTYEDSIGYDDIKDLPIEWENKDESIAKLENGVIVPVGAGSVDLVGTRGNDIYTIHLTVEKETIPEKIDKMTIKVPITGSKFKAWVVVVSVVLLGVIGTCSYMLIRRKK